MNTTDFDKLKLALRGRLIGLSMIDPEYNWAIKAFNFAESVHDGLRKDGVTREFYHMISILGMAMDHHANFINPCQVYIDILLHDTVEDYPQYQDEVRQLFGVRANGAFLLSKKVHYPLIEGGFRSETKPTALYFKALAEDPSASAMKGFDREHNLSTMMGVFKLKKQLAYAAEVKEHFLPMLKEAKRRFPEQDAIYENIKSMLNTEVRFVEHYCNALLKAGCSPDEVV